ncbi:hypothetical protein CIW49_00060 [Mycolicibacterium sp. P1-18]|nr:hypothetical protein CIW49_00060 [Mycolicibacterium sp. P1-18]
MLGRPQLLALPDGLGASGWAQFWPASVPGACDRLMMVADGACETLSAMVQGMDVSPGAHAAEAGAAIPAKRPAKIPAAAMATAAKNFEITFLP